MNLNLSALIGKTKATATIGTPSIKDRIANAVAIVNTAKVVVPGSVNEWAEDALVNTGPPEEAEQVSMPGRAGWIKVNPQAYRDRISYLENVDGMDTSDAQGCADAEVFAAQRRIDMRTQSAAKIAEARAKQEAARKALNPEFEDTEPSVVAPDADIDLTDAIVTAPGESLIESVAEARSELADKIGDALAHKVAVEIVADDERTMEQRVEDSNTAAEILAAAREAERDDKPTRRRKNFKADRESKAKKIAEEQPPKRKPGRPKKPDALSGAARQALSQQKLKSAGGKRTTLNLSAGAVERIAKLVKAGKFETERDAIEYAILTVQLP